MITLIVLIFLSIFSLSFGMLLFIKPDIAAKVKRHARLIGVFLVGLSLFIIYIIHKL